jgi:Ca2+-binding EF-hand superfamily protein
MAFTEDQVSQFVQDMMGFADTGDESKLQSMFNAMDVNGDGTVDRPELRRVLLGFAGNEATAVSDEQVDGWLEQLDTNSDGKIQWSEFLQHYKDKLKG